MQHLFSAEGEAAITDLLRKPALLAFDFDGTLTPIVARADDVQLDPAVANRLCQLAALRPVAIVTGRSVADLRPRLGFEPTYLMGSHGAEDESTPAATAARVRQLDPGRQRMAELATTLAAAGVTVEDKGVSLALHFRLAADPARAQAAIDTLLLGLPTGLRHFGGKCVCNLVPADAPDKADALRALVARSGSRVALYAGDDVNDEPVFEQAPPDWLTIRIGQADTASNARFRLDNPQQTALLLDRLHTQLVQTGRT